MKVNDDKNTSSVINKYCGCIVTGNIIEGNTGDVCACSYTADPNTHLLYPKTMIPAVRYLIKKGRSVLKTDVISKWNHIKTNSKEE